MFMDREVTLYPPELLVGGPSVLRGSVPHNPGYETAVQHVLEAFVDPRKCPIFLCECHLRLAARHPPYFEAVRDT